MKRDLNYIECDCTDSSHILRIELDPKYNEFNFEIQLRQTNNLLKRLVIAAKYVVGLRNTDCQWDCIMLTEDGIERLQKLISRFKREIKRGPEAKI